MRVGKKRRNKQQISMQREETCSNMPRRSNCERKYNLEQKEGCNASVPTEFIALDWYHGYNQGHPQQETYIAYDNYHLAYKLDNIDKTHQSYIV